MPRVHTAILQSPWKNAGALWPSSLGEVQLGSCALAQEEMRQHSPSSRGSALRTPRGCLYPLYSASSLCFGCVDGHSAVGMFLLTTGFPGAATASKCLLCVQPTSQRLGGITAL